MVQFKVMTPEEYKTNYSKFIILYGFHSTPFGKCLIGITNTDKAVVHLTFASGNPAAALNGLKSEWPLSEVVEDTESETGKIITKIFPEKGALDETISVLLKGTEFQVKVWESLASIPQGTSTTYEKVAQLIEKPKAARAVGNAVMKNKIAYLVPCHRVMGKSGSDKYSWGLERKHNILTYESNIG